MGQVTSCCNCSVLGRSRSPHRYFVVQTIQLLDRGCHIIYSTTSTIYGRLEKNYGRLTSGAECWFWTFAGSIKLLYSTKATGRQC